MARRYWRLILQDREEEQHARVKYDEDGRSGHYSLQVRSNLAALRIGRLPGSPEELMEDISHAAKPRASMLR